MIDGSFYSDLWPDVYEESTAAAVSEPSLEQIPPPLDDASMDPINGYLSMGVGLDWSGISFDALSYEESSSSKWTISPPNSITNSVDEVANALDAGENGLKMAQAPGDHIPLDLFASTMPRPITPPNITLGLGIEPFFQGHSTNNSSVESSMHSSHTESILGSQFHPSMALSIELGNSEPYPSHGQIQSQSSSPSQSRSQSHLHKNGEQYRQSLSYGSSIGPDFDYSAMASTVPRRPRIAKLECDEDLLSVLNRHSSGHVSKLKSPKKAQKGEAITLAPPSYAEFNTQAGQFMFINMRKDNAWTRQRRRMPRSM